MSRPNEDATRRGVTIGSRIVFTHHDPDNEEEVEVTRVVVGFDQDGDPIPEGSHFGLVCDCYRALGEPVAKPDVTAEKDAQERALTRLYSAPSVQEVYKGNAALHSLLAERAQNLRKMRGLEWAPEVLYAEVLFDFYEAYEDERQRRIQLLQSEGT